MRPPSAVQCPIASFVREVEEDETLSRSERRHFAAVGRAAWRASRGAPILHKAAVSGFLVAYKAIRQRGTDGATAGRLLSELTRCGRVLGVLGALDGGGRGYRAPAPRWGSADVFKPPAGGRGGRPVEVDDGAEDDGDDDRG